MTYLITQTFILLLIAALLGFILGWYLTRISAFSSRATLQARLNTAEKDARELRAELDDAVTARGSAEAERNSAANELVALRKQLEGVSGQDAELLELREQLDTCRGQLAQVSVPEAVAMAAAAVEQAPPEAEPSAALGRMAPPTAEDGAAADNLQQIKGIGPKIAGILDQLGIRRFDQIAAWTPENIEWVNDHLRFKGRIEREEWIAQAQALIAARRDLD